MTAVLFAKLHPAQIRVEGPRRRGARPPGGALRADGATVRQPYLLPEAAWTLTPRPGDHRELRGALSAWAEAREVVLVATLALEDYVAEAIASETLPWAPPAVAARAGDRHALLAARGRRRATHGHGCATTPIARCCSAPA